MRNLKILWGVIAVLLIAVVILSSVLSADVLNRRQVDMNPDQTKQNESVKVIAKIGDKTITNKELEQLLMQKHGRELLNQMVDHEVIRLEGKALGIFVEESEIQKELKRMQQGYDSENQFFESMKVQLGLSPEALKTDIYDKLLQEKLITRDIIVSDAQADAYMKAHPEEFMTSAQLRLQQIIVSSKDQTAKVAADIAKKIDFAQIAKERSLDDATRDNGGDLGWVEEDDPFIAEPIMKAVKQMKVGEVSKPIEWNGQLYIVKLRDRKEQPKQSKEELMERVKKEIALREAPPMKDFLKQLRDKWKVSLTL
ncbi:peptidyl-prolyl cis-trans isomerase [Paenibacillus sp. NPDC056579]|uniref:peptidyl-prolyl cis-trans isomerase n=1 Tax=unclassified Paenibacillus TaxID=185978 RepID=UPI001EF8202F|nr:peptidyl-prolyl cis-trans isomerase [Paenibacillus sp. H1-7]ULL13342.1 peptidylprolyl isomerase [Paenibacillus sp. H1-7]